MRFLFRGIAGFLMLAATAGMIGYGVLVLMEAREDGGGHRRRGGQERSFVVNVATLREITAHPKFVAYGEIRGWRSLELRASATGRLVDMSPVFRDGAAVKAGDLLFLIDPAEARARQADAEAGLADAEAEKAEADEAITVAGLESTAAVRQRDLRQQALKRQRQLQAKGYATATSVEEAELAFATADQAVLSRSQALIVARKRVERTALAITRANIVLEDAGRILDDTRVEAPFDGLLSDVDAVLGRLVLPNEKLGLLVDPLALEAVFRVSNAQFARLIDEDGALRQAPVVVTLDLGDLPVTMKGIVERAAAVVRQGQSGRLIYARLDLGPSTILLPGDFVTVTVEEPPLPGVAVIPASAATEDGRILLVGADSRVEERKVTIVRRQGDSLVVAGVPFGARYVTERLPQLGPGVKVGTVDRAAPVAVLPESANHGDEERIAISDERRIALIAFLKQNDHMPEERMARLLDLLNQPTVPRRVIERLEARMAGQG